MQRMHYKLDFLSGQEISGITLLSIMTIMLLHTPTITIDVNDVIHSRVNIATLQT